MSLDPRQYFRVEARELIASLTLGALALERGVDVSTVAHLLRLAHTLKGAARVAGEGAIADFAHASEEILVRARERGGWLGADAGELLQLLDTMADRVAMLDGATPAVAAVAEEPIATVRVAVRELDDLLGGIREIGANLAAVGHAVEVLDEASGVALALSAQARARPLQADGSSSGVVPGLEELAGTLQRCRDLLDELRGRSEAELALVRDRAEGLRLLPVGALFPVLERAAREAARDLGKQIHFDARGGDVRLDSAAHDLLRDALVQVVRNAVAHGIEPPAERADAGKDRVGTIRIVAERQDASVVLTCSDDGAGFDLEGITREAVRHGLLAPGTRVTLDEALALLGGGVSTTRSADLSSGRGVGFNVVRTAVEAARGELRVTSEPGRGTSMTIRVPAVLQAITALQVWADARPYWIPAEAVIRAARLPPTAVRWDAEGGPVAQLDDAEIPLVTLRTLAGGGPPLDGEGPLVVLVRDGARRVAVAVDRLLGLRAILTQALPRELADGLATHATLDPVGTPELVLSPAALVSAPRDPSAPEPVQPQRPLLLVEDSPTTRMFELSILEGAGYEVDVAGSAEEGLERARARSYGAILVDVELPGMDGFTFVATVRGDPVLRDVPCILVTTRGSPADRARGREVGATGYVLKGEFHQASFLALVRRALSS